MLTDEMKRLTEDIVALHDARINFVDTLIKDTSELLGTFRNEHNQMATDLRNKLETEYKELLEAVDRFMKDTHAQNQQLRSDTLGMLEDYETARQADAKIQKDNLIQFSNDLVKNTANMLLDFGNAHAEMADELQNFLGSSETSRKNEFDEMMNRVKNKISELKTYTETMLRDASKAHAKMAQELRDMLKTVTKERKDEVVQFMLGLVDSHSEMAKELNAFLENSEKNRNENFAEMMKDITARLLDLKSSTHGLLNEYAEDREGMAAAWTSLNKTMTARRTQGIEAVRKIEEKQAVFNTVSASKNGGIKLTQIGKSMGKQWQSLIPTMNELLSEGKIKKDDDGFYHMA